jgi:peptide/nickel transport system substrate-binding protein
VRLGGSAARRVGAAGLSLVLVAACAPEPVCAGCDTIVIAATGEPTTLIPPLVQETVARDISDQVFERLMNLAAGSAPIDSSGYRPGLADRWERVDSLTLRFHLRPGARWHDGQPVTSEDVVFSFEAFSDSGLASAAQPTLAGQVHAEAEGPAEVVVRFRRAYPEQLYDATWHVRVMPAHVWQGVPRAAWAADSTLARLVGSGPYRVGSWVRGQSLTLIADSSGGRARATIPRAIWRFAGDPDAALNLVLAHEADLMEAVGTPDRVARVEADSALGAVTYPAAVYGFAGFNVANRQSPVGNRSVRRGLEMAVDRTTLAQAAYGPGTLVPPGPMSKLLWIWSDSIATIPFDSAEAGRALDQAGWRLGSDGLRRQGGRVLGFDILVPATSGGRRRIAEALQEAWRRIGARVTVTAVDFPVFQERLGRGRFDIYVGAWLDEPSPRSLADQWTSAGVGLLNYGGYRSPAFDALFVRALAERDVPRARAVWREALDTLNADAPALFLYALSNTAAVSRRVAGVTIDPYSWLAGLPSWTLTRGPK